MKKFAIATVIALAATAASALEVGVTTARDYAGDNRNAVGLTLGKKVGAVGITAGFDRATSGTNNQDRYSLVAGVDVAKLGPVSVAVKGGAAYLNNQTGQDGYAALVGVGATLPVTKTMALTLDATRQYGQDRVSQFDGNRVTAGVRYSF
jgi:outer membrane autotransporter protein